MYAEDDLLPISSLQHLAFCERQWALIYLEGLWAENRLTAEGRILHERTDQPETESRGDLRIARALRLRSLRLGLAGQADVVEFHRADEGGAALEGAAGRWVPFPVEYKRGKPKPDPCDLVQLCAQALCLEEMLRCDVPAGAMFYGAPRRRLDVMFDAPLRGETERTAARLRELWLARVTPRAVYARKCDGCSLCDLCMPPRPASGRSAAEYLRRALADIAREEAK